MIKPYSSTTRGHARQQALDILKELGKPTARKEHSIRRGPVPRALPFTVMTGQSVGAFLQETVM